MSDAELNNHTDRVYIKNRAKMMFNTSRKDNYFGATKFMRLVSSVFRKVAKEYSDAPEELRQRMSEFRFAVEFVMCYDSAVETWNQENHWGTKEQELLQEEKEKAHDDMRILRSILSKEEFSALMERVEKYREAEYEYHSDEG